MNSLPKHNPIKSQGHTFVIGITRSGKSWYSMFRMMFAPPPDYEKGNKIASIREINIFFDTNNSSRTPDYQREILKMNTLYHNSVSIVHSVDEFIKDFENAHCRYIIVQPNLLEEIGEYAEKVENIVEIVRKYQAMLPQRVQEDIYLFFDEISALAPKWTESKVSFIFTRGLQLKIHGIAISQRPSLCNKTIFCEACHTVVFKLRNEDYVGLRRYGLDVPFECQRDIAAHKYQFWIYDSTNWERGTMPGQRGKPTTIRMEDKKNDRIRV